YESVTHHIISLSLHDALPILEKSGSTFTGYYSPDGEEWTALGEPLQNADAAVNGRVGLFAFGAQQDESATARFDYFRLVGEEEADRKSTRLNSSHVSISYAVF